MSLAHNVQSVKKPPHLIAVIGASGAGKTVYLGLLMDLLTRHVGLLRSTARGPMSISLQQTTTTALSTGWFPEKTVTTPEHWHWVHCQFNCRRRRRPLELVIPDLSGEALGIETERSNRYPAIRSLLTKCAGVIVLADAERLQVGRQFSRLPHAEAAVAHRRTARRAGVRLATARGGTASACTRADEGR